MEHGFEETVDLVRRAQDGDGGALGALLERYLPRVRSLVRARIGAGLRREMESGDVVQDTMADVLRGFERFDMRDEAAFVKWLSAIVENRLRQDARYFRAAQRDRGREVARAAAARDSVDPAGAVDPAESAETPAEEVARGELLERIRAARTRLDAKQRLVLELRDAHGSWSDVADALGLASPDAARMLHARARTALMRAVALGPGADAEPR